MGTIAVFIYFLSVCCFAGCIHQFMETGRPGIFPSKRLLKKRAVTLGMAGGGLLVFGALISLLN
ncbi:hypothetical protein [Bacillus massilinigeriensis]|uniref:hypothetical protein n=1 Tax=Bacillus mediterraneensis TaxID=1805474 RepID=UPI0008F8126F|nr:hypothetical protein [Bacillus mediterraneensis]